MSNTDLSSTDLSSTDLSSTDLSPGEHRPSTELTVRPWWDPTLATHGFDPRDAYVERFWLGVAGPSVIWLLRRLSRGLDQYPNGFRIDVSDTARAIGLGGGTGRQSPMNRTIDRACMFGLMRRTGAPAADGLDVRTHVPQLSRRQLERLPLAVRCTHDGWLSAAGPSSRAS